MLIFCSSRKGCEFTARHVSKFLKKFCSNAHNDTGEFVDISSAIDALRKSPAGLDPILEETLPSGVAYHHAGLTVWSFWLHLTLCTPVLAIKISCSEFTKDFS